MIKHTLFYMLAFVLCCTFQTNCIKNDVFGLSPKNIPTAIRFKDQLSAQIVLGQGTEENPDVASVEVLQTASLSKLTIEQITLPSLASVAPAYSEVHDFSKPVKFTIYAEDKQKTRILWVSVSQGAFKLNPDYSSLTDNWFVMGNFSNGDPYYGVGEIGASTAWANTNVVAAILNKASCFPSDFPRPTGHAVIQTLQNPTAGKTVGSGIASGILFLGNFRGNPQFFLDRDKQGDNLDMGIPYGHKPTKMFIDYKYAPGNKMERWERSTSGSAKWQEIPLSGQTDSMEILIVLHNRYYDETTPSSSVFKRIAAGGFISAEAKTEWQTIAIPIHYGQATIEAQKNNPNEYRIATLNSEYNRFVYQHQPIQDQTDPTKWRYTAFRVKELWATENDPVTHISLSLKSSANGYRYEGAGENPAEGKIGSKLEIKNIRFE